MVPAAGGGGMGGALRAAQGRQGEEVSPFVWLEAYNGACRRPAARLGAASDGEPLRGRGVT